jgi:hypothetical protein
MLVENYVSAGGGPLTNQRNKLTPKLTDWREALVNPPASLHDFLRLFMGGVSKRMRDALSNETVVYILNNFRITRKYCTIFP